MYTYFLQRRSIGYPPFIGRREDCGTLMQIPSLIQGGMGVGVSNWQLARAVSGAGQLGVIAGTGLDGILARRLQDGDPGGHMRRALSAFPFPESARRILNRYFIPGGLQKKHRYRQVPFFSVKDNPELNELTVAANFAETWLAKESQNGVVGVNYLEKVQLPTLASIYGALLAGIDYIIMGAGIPLQIPGLIQKLTRNLPAALQLSVDNAGKDDKFFSNFDPSALFGRKLPKLQLPKFLPIISSNLLADLMAKKASGPIDGIIVEDHAAGGHNAPPRGKMAYDDAGEPIYGARDQVDTEKLKKLNLPFWMAGSLGAPDRYQAALETGAAGIQVGTPFALCKESGILPQLKKRIIESISRGEGTVKTDTHASPTGFPFKILQLLGTLSDLSVFESRKRVCNLGYLRQLYKKEDGSIGYRCPAERPSSFVKKGGCIDEGTAGKRCLCNALFATVGMPTAYSNGYTEKAVVTIGSWLDSVKDLLTGKSDFSARDVIDSILRPGCRA
jgi:nitronate monooxygenase